MSTPEPTRDSFTATAPTTQRGDATTSARTGQESPTGTPSSTIAETAEGAGSGAGDQQPQRSVSVTGLSVNPDTVEPGEQVTIVATVEHGGEERATRDLELQLLGEVVSVRTVSLPPGDSQQVEFVRQIEVPGTHRAQVGNQTVSVVVEGTDSTVGTPARETGPGFTAVAALVALLGLGAWTRRRR